MAIEPAQRRSMHNSVNLSTKVALSDEERICRW
jgi:hypothetical protein